MLSVMLICSTLSLTIPELHNAMDKSLDSMNEDYSKAPNIPLWPNNLPKPLRLKIGQKSPINGMLYPNLTNFATQYHLDYFHNKYWDLCQKRIIISQEYLTQIVEQWEAYKAQHGQSCNDCPTITTQHSNFPLNLFIGSFIVAFVSGAATTYLIMR